MDHSVQAYIQKRSTGELLHFLEMCKVQNQWDQYVLTIPHIFATLQCRNVAVPEQTQTAWEHFLSNTETSTE